MPQLVSTQIYKTIRNIKKLIDNYTIIVEDFNTTFTAMERSPKQKINKETMALNDTLDQVDLIDLFGTSHPQTAEDTFFSGAHGAFSKTDHILGQKQASINTKRLKSYHAPFFF